MGLPGHRIRCLLRWIMPMGYSATLVFSSMTALMTRAFYSIHDSKTPLFGGLFGIVILYLLNVIFRNLTGIGSRVQLWLIQ